MNNQIDVGGADFAKMRTNHKYYVDKTEILYDLFEKTSNEVTLFTRPRRFGKTLMMSMIENFFNIDKKSQGLFNDLKIMNHPDFVKNNMNQYPVIFLSFKDVEGNKFSLAYNQLKNKIATLCKNHRYLLESNRVDQDDQIIFERLKSKTADEEEIQNSLNTLTRMMYDCYGKKVIILIDEYDVPLAKATENGYYPQMLEIIRGMLSAALKDNVWLRSSVLTGCLRIPKESIFTGVNNFVCYSVLSQRFASYFGFTGEEVDQLLTKYNLSEKGEILKLWYDGYRFGDTEVYCPWDVMNYVSDLMDDINAQPQNYWENSSSNAILDFFLDNEKTDYSDSFETLMNGGSIHSDVTDALTYDTIDQSEKNLWSVLLMTGYLTIVDGASLKDVQLRIPNREVENIFETMVVDHFNRNVDHHEVNKLISALYHGDDKKATDILSDLLWLTISYNDYGENYYHAFLAGIFVGQGASVKSNREQGLGRPDIILKNRSARSIVIIEVKKADTKDQMVNSCHQAIHQIDERGYDQKLRGYRTIKSYGIAFYQKEALVMLKSDVR